MPGKQALILYAPLSPNSSLASGRQQDFQNNIGYLGAPEVKISIISVY
jgi:hypothetical protein